MKLCSCHCHLVAPLQLRTKYQLSFVSFMGKSVLNYARPFGIILKYSVTLTNLTYWGPWFRLFGLTLNGNFQFHILSSLSFWVIINFKVYLSKRQYIWKERAGKHGNSPASQYILLLPQSLLDFACERHKWRGTSGALCQDHDASYFRLDSRLSNSSLLWDSHFILSLCSF